MATSPEPASSRRPVLAIVTPWFPNPYQPITGIFVARQVEALRSEMDVMLIHTQMYCELPEMKLMDFFLRRKRRAIDATAVVPDRTVYFPFRRVAKVIGVDRAVSMLSWRVRKALQRLPQKPDAVLAWISWPTACATDMAARRLGLKPAVMECNGAFPEEAALPALKPHLLGLYRGDAVKLTVSPFMSQIIRNTLGRDFRAHECGCVIDHTFFALPLERPAREKKRGLCVGAVYEDKGQGYIVAAAALLKQRGMENFEITCAGTGPDLAAFRRRATEAGVDHLVKFPGLVTEEEKLRLYAESDFFVMPTLQDTFGAVVAEAMAAGLPVISTPNGSAEWIVDDHTGIHCRAADPESLAGALAKMLADGDRFDRNVIRSRVRQLFGEAAYTSGIRSALGI